MVKINKTFFANFIESANTMLQHSALSFDNTCYLNVAYIDNDDFYLPKDEAEVTADALITIPIGAPEISVYDATQLTKAIEVCVFEIDGCSFNITASAGSLSKFIEKVGINN